MFKQSLMTMAVALLPATSALAAPIDPTIGTFGDLADVGSNVTFSGTGIPTDATNYDVFTNRLGDELILGLSITPRFSAPTPVNDGDGSFAVTPGLVGGATRWNFSFYAELKPTNGSSLTIQDVGLELLYDLDSAFGTDISDLGVINAALYPTSTTTIAQDSQNLTFGYLSTGFPGFNTPGLNTFSPDFGEYSFLLRTDGFSVEADQGIGVIANAGPVPVVPLPAGLPLLLAGLGSFAFMRRRGNAKA